MPHRDGDDDPRERARAPGVRDPGPEPVGPYAPEDEAFPPTGALGGDHPITYSADPTPDEGGLDLLRAYEFNLFPARAGVRDEGAGRGAPDLAGLDLPNDLDGRIDSVDPLGDLPRDI